MAARLVQTPGKLAQMAGKLAQMPGMLVRMPGMLAPLVPIGAWMFLSARGCFPSAFGLD